MIAVNGANWETNMWQSWELEIVGGTGIGQFRRIISNTLDKMTPRKNFDENPDNTTVFILRPRYPMDNPNDFKTINKVVTLASIPELLTEPTNALVVPNGWPVLLIADPSNASKIYFAYSSAATLDTSTRCTLDAGKSIALYIPKTDLIWLACESDGDAAAAFVPQWQADA
jgi:hypothetical protein